MSAQYKEDKLETEGLNIRMVKRLRLYLFRYRKQLAISLILTILMAIPGLFEPHLIKIGIDKYIFAGSYRGIFFISIIYVIVRIAGWLLRVVHDKLTFRLGQTILHDMRMEVFNHIQNLSMDYFDKTPQGRIIARVDTDVSNMEHVMTWGAGILIYSILILIGATYFMAMYNLKLFFAVSIVLVILAVATGIFHREGTKAYRKVRETSAQITTNLAESISGIRIIQAFVREKRNLKGFEKITSNHVENVLNSSKVWSTYWPVVSFSNSIGVGIILLYGGYMVINSQMKIGELNAYILYMGMFFWPIFSMGELYNSLLQAGTSAERIFQLLDTKPKVVDQPGSVNIDIKGHVVFENVCFAYKEDEFVLKNINFEVKPGQNIALVGRTGAGKSTIANLIGRFYEPQKGNIYIDGNEIRNIKLFSLRSQMGIVPQDSFLFSGTIMQNLKYGLSNINDNDVIKASTETGLHPFIDRLSGKYNTQVKERGIGLSEGERQLICITRAFIANPKLLILDEATSAVDTHTETVIQKAIEKLLKHRTCFVIAQRLSTIRNVDCIFVISGGELIEKGTHTELLNKKGAYDKMYKEFTTCTTTCL